MQEGLLSPLINTGRLEEVLRGAGLKDVNIRLSTSQSEGYAFDTDIRIEKDRSEEITRGMQQQFMG